MILIHIAVTKLLFIKIFSLKKSQEKMNKNLNKNKQVFECFLVILLTRVVVFVIRIDLLPNLTLFLRIMKLTARTIERSREFFHVRDHSIESAVIIYNN